MEETNAEKVLATSMTIIMLGLFISIVVAVTINNRNDRKVHETAIRNGYDQVQNIGGIGFHWTKRSGEITDQMLQQRQLKFETEFDREFESRYRKDLKSLLSAYNTFKKQINNELTTFKSSQTKRKK